jgi:hypothetical protein
VADDFIESVNRSADGMIRIYDTLAAAQARATLARMSDQRDRVGERMWLAILKAIEKKQRPKEP